MTRAEFLTQKQKEKSQRYMQKHTEFYTNPSTARIDPFKIADGLYYVGDKEVCIHLIDTGDGLILLDSGFFGAAHLLVDSIWRAGFDPKNVRWILHTHGHSDHFGASEEFRNMYGTKLAISRIDAEKLRSAPIVIPGFPFAKAPEFDRELEDGEIFELGNKKIRCVLTPGHTQGVLTLFFDVTWEGKTYLAGLFGGAGVNALSLPGIFYSKAPANAPEQMLESIDKVWNEPVVFHLGNHPDNNQTLKKRRLQPEEGGNPFLAPESWQSFLTELQKKVRKTMADNEEMAKEMQSVCED